MSALDSQTRTLSRVTCLERPGLAPGTPVCFSDNFELRLDLVQLKLLTVTNAVNDRALTRQHEAHETYVVPSG